MNVLGWQRVNPVGGNWEDTEGKELLQSKIKDGENTRWLVLNVTHTLQHRHRKHRDDRGGVTKLD